MRSNRGMTLIEVVVAVAAMTLLAVGIGLIANQFLKSSVGLENSQLAKSSVQSLGAHILRLGRLAGSSPTGAGPTYHTCSVLANELDCEVDYNNPPNGNLTTVRFRFDAATKIVYFETQLVGPPVSWRTDLTYENITQFDLCGDTAGCTLLPAQLNTSYQTFLANAATLPIAKNRFFRFHIRGAVQATGTVGAAAGFVDYQSAFYVRNPPSFDAAAAFPVVATGM